MKEITANGRDISYAYFEGNDLIVVYADGDSETVVYKDVWIKSVKTIPDNNVDVVQTNREQHQTTRARRSYATNLRLDTRRD